MATTQYNSSAAAAAAGPAFFNLLLLSCITLLITSTVAATVPVASTTVLPPVMKYWEEVLPTTPLPDQLKKLASPLSAAQVAYYDRQLMQKQPSSRITSYNLCVAGKLYCDANAYARSEIPSCGIQFGFWRPTDMSLARNQRGSFFKQSQLLQTAGAVANVVMLQDQNNRSPTTTFLPRVLARRSTSNLHVAADALRLMGIPASSRLARDSMQTARECAAGGIPAEDLVAGEHAFCVSSLEDLADRLKGTNPAATWQLLKVSVPAGSPMSFPARLLHVELAAGADSSFLSCHARTSPYAVLYCHSTPKTLVYSATLQTTLDAVNPATVNAVAVCHMDTSDWSPLHVAFSDLQSAPGKTEACHWTHENSLVFVPAKLQE